ncbi:hypothetical protein EDC04DRAFT_2910332 [Pisolithus marmoratus]|nr:hypothetical protein EDC04DRAFT_2910332 [Pisolithus marmoratus]
MRYEEDRFDVIIVIVILEFIAPMQNSLKVADLKEVLVKASALRITLFAIYADSQNLYHRFLNTITLCVLPTVSRLPWLPGPYSLHTQKPSTVSPAKNPVPPQQPALALPTQENGVTRSNARVVPANSTKTFPLPTNNTKANNSAIVDEELAKRKAHAERFWRNANSLPDVRQRKFLGRSSRAQCQDPEKLKNQAERFGSTKVKSGSKRLMGKNSSGDGDALSVSELQVVRHLRAFEQLTRPYPQGESLASLTGGGAPSVDSYKLSTLPSATYLATFIALPVLLCMGGL